MKFQAPMFGMNEAVKAVVGFTAPSTEAKEMQCIRIEATSDGTITLVAQNRTSWIEYPLIGATVVTPGIALIPGAEMRRWLAACPADKPLEVEESNNLATLKTGKSVFSVATLDPKNYPEIESRSKDPTTVVLPGNEFVRAATSALIAVEKKENKLINTNVMQIAMTQGEVAFVCTDTKAISIIQLQANVVGPDRAELLPAPAMNTLIPLIEGGGDVTISLSKHECIIRTERISFGTKLVDSKMMPWRAVMKAWDVDAPEKTFIPAKYFLSGVKQVAAADPSDPRLEVQFAMGMVGLSTKAAKAVVDVPACASEMQFAVTLEYMTDFFGAASRQGLNASIEPGKKGSNAIILRAGKDWRYVVVFLISDQNP